MFTDKQIISKCLYPDVAKQIFHYCVLKMSLQKTQQRSSNLSDSKKLTRNNPFTDS